MGAVFSKRFLGGNPDFLILPLMTPPVNKWELEVSIDIITAEFIGCSNFLWFRDMTLAVITSLLRIRFTMPIDET